MCPPACMSPGAALQGIAIGLSACTMSAHVGFAHVGLSHDRLDRVLQCSAPGEPVSSINGLSETLSPPCLPVAYVDSAKASVVHMLCTISHFEKGACRAADETREHIGKRSSNASTRGPTTGLSDMS